MAYQWNSENAVMTPDQLERFLATLRKREDVKAIPREGPATVPAAAPMVGLTEAARALDCHRRTVRSYLRRGLLPGRLLAGRWKIRREDLEAFIEGALRPIAPRSDQRG